MRTRHLDVMSPDFVASLSSDRPTRIGVLPYTFDSEPTQIATTAAGVAYHLIAEETGIAPVVGFSGEADEVGRTGEGMSKILRELDVPARRIKDLDPDNTSPGQMRRLRDWGVDDVVGFRNHLDPRVRRIARAGRMGVGLIAVDNVLETPKALEVIGSQEDLDYMRRATEFFDRDNGERYESNLRLRLATLATMPMGLRGMAWVFDKLGGGTANHLSMPGHGTPEDPFSLYQARGVLPSGDKWV